MINHFRDTRAVYCAASIATMLKFDDRELFKNSEKYLQSCQSWDGGFGPGESFCLWFVVEKDLNLKYQPGFVFVRRFCFRDEIFFVFIGSKFRSRFILFLFSHVFRTWPEQTLKFSVYNFLCPRSRIRESWRVHLHLCRGPNAD